MVYQLEFFIDEMRGARNDLVRSHLHRLPVIEVYFTCQRGYLIAALHVVNFALLYVQRFY